MTQNAVSAQALARSRRIRLLKEMDRDDALYALINDRVSWMGLPFTDAQRAELRSWLFGKVKNEWSGLTYAACLEASDGD